MSAWLSILIIANAKNNVVCSSNMQLILESPLLPLFQRRRSGFPLFEKEGLGEIRMSTWIIERELMRLY